MKASEHGQPAYGHGKFWAARGASPEVYQNGPYDTREQAEAEAREVFGPAAVVVIGVGSEVNLSVPDADQIIDQICEGVYDECGDLSEDYLDHHAVTKEVKAELTAAVEKVVADWLTKHKLWPSFCSITPADTPTDQSKGA